jgi:hypothetical protein
MIVDAFTAQTYVENRMDVQHTPLYDTFVVAAGNPLSLLTSALFTNVGPASGKTQAQTNMDQQRKLSAPQSFSVFGVRIRWSEDILLADLLTVLNGFCFEMYLGDKWYQRAPLWFYSAGGGINTFTTRTASSTYNNGSPTREAMHKLAIPIVIENQMTFYAQLQGTTVNMAAAAAGGTGLTLVCLLDGLYARGVQ